MYDPLFDSDDKRFIPGTVVNFENNFCLPKNAGCSTVINTLAFCQSSDRLLSKFSNGLTAVQD